MHLFRATGLVPVPPRPEADERIEQATLHARRGAGDDARGEIREGKTLVALLLEADRRRAEGAPRSGRAPGDTGEQRNGRHPAQRGAPPPPNPPGLVVVLQAQVGDQLLARRWRSVFLSFISWMKMSCSG